MVEAMDFLQFTLKANLFRIVQSNTDCLLLILGENTLQDCIRDEQISFFQKVYPIMFNPPEATPKAGKFTLKMHLKGDWHFMAISTCNYVILENRQVQKRKLSGYNCPDVSLINILQKKNTLNKNEFLVPHTNKRGATLKKLIIPKNPLQMRIACVHCIAVALSCPTQACIIDTFPQV